MNRINVDMTSVSPLLKRNTGKKDIIEYIEKNTKNCMNDNIDKILIYYSGHGKEEDGSWVTYTNKTEGLDMEEYCIKIEEVLDTIKKCGFNNHLEITSDACYSGKSCYNAKVWWEDDKNTTAFKSL